jgi:DnaJ-class molecular chaperone
MEQQKCLVCNGKGYVWIWLQKIKQSMRMPCSVCMGVGSRST